MDIGGANAPLLDFADGVVGLREVCHAFDKAPYIPVAGMSSPSSPEEKLQVDLLVSG